MKCKKGSFCAWCRWMCAFLFFLISSAVQALVIADSPIVSVSGIWPFPTGSNIADDYVEVLFEGTGIRWKGVKWPNAGCSLVTIDGDSITTLDQYSPRADAPFSWEKKGLPAGLHTLRITVLGKKNPLSTDAYVNFNLGFETIGAAVTKAGRGWVTNGLNSNKTAGHYVEVQFEGDGIRWNGFKFANAGKSKIAIDGVEMETVDQYGMYESPFSWEKTGLGKGAHVLRVSVTGEKNASSKEAWINYSGFETSGTKIVEQGECWEVTEHKVHRSNGTDDGVEVAFTGSGIRWMGMITDDSGYATVSLDGAIVDVIDLYGEGNNLMPFVWERRGLDEGTHRLLIAPGTQKNQLSHDYFINYTTFQSPAFQSFVGVEEALALPLFRVSNHQVMINDDRYVGESLQLVLFSMDGKVCFKENWVVDTAASLNLPQGMGSCIIQISNGTGERMFACKYFSE